MKNLITFGLVAALLLFAGLGCKNNPLAKYTKQYGCTIAGEPEPQTADDFVKRGYKHIESKNYADEFDPCAFGAAQEAIRLDPQNAAAYGLRGRLYQSNREYDRALDDLNEAIRLDPQNPQPYFFRSVVFEKKNMLKEAIEDASFPMKDEATHHQYARRGGLYFKKDEFDNALRDYSKAIELRPDEENYYTMRAEVYRKLGKTAEAEADELKAKIFEDRQIPDGPPPSSPIPEISGKPAPQTISGGVVNGKATNLVKPPYPAAAKAVRASGAVNVQVTIDETGDVVSATAVSGHPLLRAAAVSAARSSKFAPTMLSGKPVRVTGVIVYNFAPE